MQEDNTIPSDLQKKAALNAFTAVFKRLGAPSVQADLLADLLYTRYLEGKPDQELSFTLPAAQNELYVQKTNPFFQHLDEVNAFLQKHCLRQPGLEQAMMMGTPFSEKWQEALTWMAQEQNLTSEEWALLRDPQTLVVCVGGEQQDVESAVQAFVKAKAAHAPTASQDPPSVVVLGTDRPLYPFHEKSTIELLIEALYGPNCASELEKDALLRKEQTRFGKALEIKNTMQSRWQMYEDELKRECDPLKIKALKVCYLAGAAQLEQDLMRSLPEPLTSAFGEYGPKWPTEAQMMKRVLKQHASLSIGPLFSIPMKGHSRPSLEDAVKSLSSALQTKKWPSGQEIPSGQDYKNILVIGQQPRARFQAEIFKKIFPAMSVAVFGGAALKSFNHSSLGTYLDQLARTVFEYKRAYQAQELLRAGIPAPKEAFPAPYLPRKSASEQESAVQSASFSPSP